MLRLCLALVLVSAPPALATQMANAKGAQLSILDKLTGKLENKDVVVGQAGAMGRISVQLNECRYPANNQIAEAEAHVTIFDAAVATPVFKGWMIASSPALSALDHPRYDVWVKRCDVPQLNLPAAAALPEGQAPADGETTEGAVGQ